MVLGLSSSVLDERKCLYPYDCEGTDSSAQCDPRGNAYSGCAYDYQGRRTMKKVTVDGTVTQHQYFMPHIHLTSITQKTIDDYMDSLIKSIQKISESLKEDPYGE